MKLSCGHDDEVPPGLDAANAIWGQYVVRDARPQRPFLLTILLARAVGREGTASGDARGTAQNGNQLATGQRVCHSLQWKRYMARLGRGP